MRYTVLINKENKIKKKYQEKLELEKIQSINQEEIYIEKETYNAYIKMKESLKKEHIEIGIFSAYQELKSKTEEKFPNNRIESGCSEHNTGLAIDIRLKIKGKWEEENEPNKKEYQKIQDTLALFGFILRYPKEKEKITGYTYNPYHIRYVGLFPAIIIKKNNLTLEEYLNNYGTILYVNKPKGLTSFEVVEKISKLYGIKRIGHTGTLDPLATGVMIIAIGQATKIVELLTAQDKEYIAEVELGYKTDTYDNTGNIIGRKEVPKEINVEKTLKSFEKTYKQEVPIYSAIKVNGKKLYEYARKKEDVVLPKKEVTIKKIELLEEKENSFTFKTLVTKGCYIRSLIQDIGDSLNTYATMTNLIRTKQGNISLENTNTLEEIEKGTFQSYKIEEVLDYPIIEVEGETEFKIANGSKIENKWNIQEKVIFKEKKGKILGIYTKEGEYLKTWKNFRNEN